METLDYVVQETQGKADKYESERQMLERRAPRIIEALSLSLVREEGYCITAIVLGNFWYCVLRLDLEKRASPNGSIGPIRRIPCTLKEFISQKAKTSYALAPITPEAHEIFHQVIDSN